MSVAVAPEPDAARGTPPGVPGAPDRGHRRNFVLLVIGNSIFAFGWAMPTIIRAPYLNWLGLSNAMIAFTGSVWCLSLVGTFFAPALSRRFHRKKWLAFFITLPYILSDAAIGVAIVTAVALDSYEWLPAVTIAALVFWPFAAGWYVPPANEYIANCIPKERIGAFCSAQQFTGGVLGVAGSLAMTALMKYADVPIRYGLGFLIAYVLAQLAITVQLFARETPAPPPRETPSFWLGAKQAVADPIFRRLLIVEFALWTVVQFPQLFMPLLAIREWGMPDWVASAFATAFTAASIVGAVLAGWLGRRFGWSRALVVLVAFYPVSFAALCWPRAAEVEQDAYRGVVASSAGESEGSRTAAGHFAIVSHQAINSSGESRAIEITFSAAVDPISFNQNDVIVRDADGDRVPIVGLEPADGSGQRWTLTVSDSTGSGAHALEILPYIRDRTGRPLDQDGDGRTPSEVLRFIISAIFYGIPFMGMLVALDAMMYLLAPDDCRGSYFSVFRTVNFAAPTLAFAISGVAFRPGNYQYLFAASGAILVILLLFARSTLKPLEQVGRAEGAAP